MRGETAVPRTAETDRRTGPGSAPAATVPVRRKSDAPLRIRSVSTSGLFLLGCLYTLVVARDFLMPLTLGLMLSFLFRPVVRALRRLGLPEPLGAAAVVAVLLGGTALGLYSLARPTAEWLARAPETLKHVEAKARVVLQPVAKVQQTAEQVERIATLSGRKPPAVAVAEEGWGRALFGGLHTLAGGVVTVFSLLYFLLAAGDTLLRKIVRALSGLRQKKNAVEIAREIERNVSSYLYVSTVINVFFGVAVWLAMWALGLPNPALWAVLAAVTSFIPYVGGVVCAVALALAALLTFDSWAWIAAVPVTFLVLDTVKGYVVTPLLTGRLLTLDPAVLLIGLLFWWWVWGLMGAVLAVPMMSTLRIFCGHIHRLAPVAELLGDERAS